MAGLEGIDANKMDIIDALGARRFVYDPGERVARPLVRHTDFVPVAINREERVVEKVRFGLPMQGGRIITNARDDKVASSPGWKALFGKDTGHCMTAISFVVERDTTTGDAFRIQRRDGRLIVVPGLVARRHYTFASTGNEYDDLGHVQLTAPANDLVATVHDRFVVELDTPAKQDAWMAPESAGKESLLDLLRPAPNDRYELVPIAPDVWTRRNDPAAVAPTGTAIAWSDGMQERSSKSARTPEPRGRHPAQRTL